MKIKQRLVAAAVLALSLAAGAIVESQTLWTVVQSSTHGANYVSSVGGAHQIDAWVRCNYIGPPCTVSAPEDQALRKFSLVGPRVYGVNTQLEHWRLTGLSGRELETVTIPDYFVGWSYVYGHKIQAF